MFARYFYRTINKFSSIPRRPLLFTSFAITFGVHLVKKKEKHERAYTKTNKEESPYVSRLVTLVNGHPDFDEDGVKSLAKKLKENELKDLPVIVICCTGKANSGKSFFANLCINYLNLSNTEKKNYNELNEDGKYPIEDYYPNTFFKTSLPNEEGTTCGINYFNYIYTMKASSGVGRKTEKVAVIFLDTEGLKGINDKDSQMLFALATNLSSHQVHFLRKEVDLASINTLLDYAAKSQDLKNKFPLETHNFRPPFLSIIIHSFEKFFDYGSINEHETLTRDLKKQMPSFKELYQHYDHITLHPIKNDTSYLGKSKINQISEFGENFYRPLTQAMFEILLPKYWVPKQIGYEKITCGHFASYLEKCASKFNEERNVQINQQKEQDLRYKIGYWKNWIQESKTAQLGIATICFFAIFMLANKFSPNRGGGGNNDGHGPVNGDNPNSDYPMNRREIANAD